MLAHAIKVNQVSIQLISLAIRNIEWKLLSSLWQSLEFAGFHSINIPSD